MIKQVGWTAVLTVAVWAQPKPANLTVHTWVREDVFAGFLGNDMDRFETGVRKLDRILAENPNDAPALAWRGGAELYRAVRAHESGASGHFRELYAKATGMFDRARQLSPEDTGVLATSGGSYAVFAERLPAELRLEAYRKIRELYGRLHDAQQQFFDKMPVHMRGEVLAGLAQASQRLDQPDETKAYLTRIVNTLAGTPYESRAKKWMERPELARSSTLVCQTCHDPGRLKNKLAQPQ